MGFWNKPFKEWGKTKSVTKKPAPSNTRTVAKAASNDIDAMLATALDKYERELPIGVLFRIESMSSARHSVVLYDTKADFLTKFVVVHESGLVYTSDQSASVSTCDDFMSYVANICSKARSERSSISGGSESIDTGTNPASDDDESTVTEEDLDEI